MRGMMRLAIMGVPGARALTVEITSAAAATVYEAFSATITFSRPVTGFEVGDITAGNATLSEFAGSGAVYTVTVTPTTTGMVTLDIAAGVCTDAAGNPNEAAAQFVRAYYTPELLLDTADSATLFQDSEGTTPAANGDLLGGWYDRSGNGNHATESGATRPTLVANALNGLPVVRFGGAHKLTVADVAGLRPDDGAYTLALVCKVADVGALNCLLAKGNPTSSVEGFAIFSEQSKVIIRGNAAGTAKCSRNRAIDTNYHVLILHLSGRAIEGYLDGQYGWVNGGGGAVAVEYSGAIDNTDPLYLGSNGTVFMSGDLACVVVIKGSLSRDEIDSLGSWLASRYNLSWSLADNPTTLIRSDSENDWLGRPVLLDTGTRWVVAYRQAAHHGQSGGGHIHLRFSDDEGANWSDTNMLPDGTPVAGAPFAGHDPFGATDPLLILAPNGHLLLHIMEQSYAAWGGTWQYRSTDGGATWASEGKINDDNALLGGQDYTIVGGDIYISVFIETGGDQLAPYKSAIYKSPDNGASWAFVSDVTSYAEGTNEIGLEYVGNDTLVCILRADSAAATFQRTSTDLGETWGDLINISATFGVFQRPRLKKIGARLYVFGRYFSNPNNYTAYHYSDDNGGTWSARQYADTQAWPDAGYCDLLARVDGSLYMLSYAGDGGNAVIKEYIIEAPA